MRDSTELEIALINDRNCQVGNICQQWSALEYLVLLIIRSLMRIDEDSARILVGAFDLGARLNVAVALAEHLEAPSRLVEGLKVARVTVQRKLEKARNRAVHGLRLLDFEDVSAEVVRMFRGKEARQPQKQTNAQLAEFGKEIAACREQLQEICEENRLLTSICAKPLKL